MQKIDSLINETVKNINGEAVRLADYCDKSQIAFENGAIYKNGQKMSTEYLKKGGRWYFVKKQ